MSILPLSINDYFSTDVVNKLDKLKVLYVTGSYPPMLCGVGDYTAKLVSEISKNSKCTIGVLTSIGAAVSGNKFLESQNVQIFPIINGWRFLELPKLVRAVCRFKSDIVHIQYPTLGYEKSWMPYFLPLLLKILGLKVVQTWHEPPTRYRFFPNAVTKDNLIGVEPDYLKQMLPRYSLLVRRKSSCYIPVGASIPRIRLTDEERSSIKNMYVGRERKMVAFFGFAYPTKSVEELFKIADPERDTLVLLTKLDAINNPYHKKIMNYFASGIWAGKVVVTGFLSADDVARALCAADAVILPFQHGVGMRNTSFLAARLQGTFTITTSRCTQGYENETNVFYAQPGDIQAMRSALSIYVGRRRESDFHAPFDWKNIVDAHLSLYINIAERNKDEGARGQMN